MSLFTLNTKEMSFLIHWKTYILKHLRILKILISHNKNNDCASDTDDLYNFLKMILTMLIQRTLLNPTIPRHNSPDSIKSLIVQIHKMKLFCPQRTKKNIYKNWNSPELIALSMIIWVIPFSSSYIYIRN